MIFLAATAFSWAFVWTLSLLFTPEGGIRQKAASPSVLHMLEAYHWVSACFALCFYLGTVRRHWSTIRLRTYEAKHFLVLGIIAACAPA